jgi:hypothetical protein
MKPNESSIDRVIRVVIAVAIGIAIAAHVVTGTAALVAGIAGGIFLITGLVGFCGIYAILGISTCPVPKKGN